jgi:hypothetical protein
VRILPGALDDTVRNLVRNPCTLWRAGQVARRADVRAELAMVRSHGIPITILWSRRDGVIPRASFDELCGAAGVDGIVVDGAHAWLLTDPEAFAELASGALGMVAR